jgi:hypothetical protein
VEAHGAKPERSRLLSEPNSTAESNTVLRFSDEFRDDCVEKVDGQLRDGAPIGRHPGSIFVIAGEV